MLESKVSYNEFVGFPFSPTRVLLNKIVFDYTKNICSYKIVLFVHKLAVCFAH